MTILGVFKANGGDVYELMINRKKENIKETKIIEIEKKITRKKLKTSLPDVIDNHILMMVNAPGKYRFSSPYEEHSSDKE